MKSPKDQKIIQIDITNYCFHLCANCTRFCGHHKKPFFMDIQTFKKAVDSLIDYPGMVGIIGGEPTLHPNFEQLIKYYDSKLERKNISTLLKPISNFALYKIEYLSNINVKRGLWTSLGEKYYEYFELIQDVFEYQCINDHRNSGLHQALLISRNDLGIPDKEWYKLRDQCWIQNEWSSSITPKGAFFCEVAGALDMLFNGPGGWPIEPGWWKRTPEEFGEQLKWCELCSACLNVPRVRANKKVDIVSPTLLKKLREVNSPKIGKGLYKIFYPNNSENNVNQNNYYDEWYLPNGDNTQRIATNNKSIYPKRLDAICLADNVKFCAGTFNSISRNLSSNIIDSSDWIIVIYHSISLCEDFRQRIMKLILNPGVLYFYGPNTKTNRPFAVLNNTDNSQTIPYFVLFNCKAKALQKENISIIYKDFQLLTLLYEQKKIIPLEDTCDQAHYISPYIRKRLMGELVYKHLLSVWQILHDFSNNIVIFPAGIHTRWFMYLLKIYNLPKPKLIFDDAPKVERIDGVKVTISTDQEIEKYKIIFICSRNFGKICVSRVKKLWPNHIVIYPYQFFLSKDLEFEEIWIESIADDNQSFSTLSHQNTEKYSWN